jgi:hypothetical protein
MSHQPYFVKCLPPELWLFKKGRTKIQSFYYSQFCYYMCRILRDSSDQCEDISLDDGTNNFWSNPICIKSYFKTRCVTKTSNYCVVAELTVSVFMYHIQCSNECLKKKVHWCDRSILSKIERSVSQYARGHDPAVSIKGGDFLDAPWAVA